MHPSGLRRVTERRVAHVLLREPSLTRIDLSRRTGLSVATIGKIIDALVAAGIVEKLAVESESAGPTLGRPADYFGLTRTRRQHVAIELGVNRTRVAALPIAGPIGDLPATQFRTPSDADSFVKRLNAAIATLEVGEPIATLISVPGVVDEREKRILYSPNLHWTEGAELLAQLSNAAPGRLVVVQEIRALALGYLVHTEPHDSYLLLDTGDGVGGALVIDGQLRTGPLPLAAEIGHTPIRGNRRVCGCGAVGCLETLLSKRGLLRSGRRNLSTSPRTWSDMLQELAQGEKTLPDWMIATLTDAASVIAGALNVMGVSKVVIVGCLLELGPAVLEHLTEAINARALWGRFGSIRVEGAPRQRLLGLTRAALDRIVLVPTSAEKVFEQRMHDTDAV